MDLSQSLVLNFLQSDDEFPIDFDDAWGWIGYTRKESARIRLEGNFEKGIDYITQSIASANAEAMKGGQNRVLIFLTVDCFKSFCMMAGTNKGKEVRRYFLDCEKHLKQLLEQQAADKKQHIVKALVSSDHTSWQKRFEDSFFDEAYRVTGWKPTKTGHPQVMGKFIKKNVYQHFPEGTTEELELVNPCVGKGRSRKHHQHLHPMGLNLLGGHQTAVLAVMRLSPDGDRKKFEKNLDKALGSQYQLELPFMNEDVA